VYVFSLAISDVNQSLNSDLFDELVESFVTHFFIVLLFYLDSETCIKFDDDDEPISVF